jgi:predicted DCC family thiol-disulfide oxidoreductase YuxK
MSTIDASDWFDDIEARARDRYASVRSPRDLTVLYDPGCSLCRRCCNWMMHQASYVGLKFVSCNESEARARYGDLPWLGDELIVVGDRGEVWVGPAAFLTCLWALVDYREWSYRLAGPALAPLAERFFHAISDRRRAISALLGHECRDGSCSLHSAP